MSEENGGKDPMPAPPSFIPSAGRKKTESQPHKSTIPSQSGSPSIPSFSPAAQPSLKCPARQQAYSATIIRNSIRFQRSTEFPSCRKLHQQTT